MKKLLLLLLPLTAFGSSVTYDFSGAFPGKLTVEDRDGVAISQVLYRNLDANSGAWIAKSFGSRGKVALSPSATSPLEDPEATAQQNRMVSEPVTVDDASMVTRWDARSLAAPLAETYRVLVIDGDTETEIFNCQGENYQWTTREVSLAAFAGRTVQVAIECTSRNKWMLAIDDWGVGVPPMEVVAPPVGAYGSLVVVDHFTGTWCNNCPAFNVQTEQMERENQGRMIVLETHVNDALACPAYYAPFGDYIHSIPGQIAMRHMDSLADQELFNQLIQAEPARMPEVEDASCTDGTVRFTIDASGMKLGLVEIYDFHDDSAPAFVQKNSASNARAEQWYYFPASIPARYMTYRNVPTGWQLTDLEGTTEISWRLSAPQFGTNPRLVLELMDPADGTVSAATVLDPGNLSGISDIHASTEGPAVYYDLQGRSVANPSHGVYIKVQGGRSSKVML